MSKLQTAIVIIILSAAVLAACLITLGWLVWARSWPFIIPEGTRDCLEWGAYNFREYGAAGLWRCLP